MAIGIPMMGGGDEKYPDMYLFNGTCWRGGYNDHPVAGGTVYFDKDAFNTVEILCSDWSKIDGQYVSVSGTAVTSGQVTKDGVYSLRSGTTSFGFSAYNSQYSDQVTITCTLFK